MLSSQENKLSLGFYGSKESVWYSNKVMKMTKSPYPGEIGVIWVSMSLDVI